jgi:OST3 / OST6 family, transporter family
LLKINVSGMNAEPFHRFLLSHAKLPEFPIVRPFNWQKLFVTFALAISIGTVTKLAWSQIQKIVTNKNSWAAASLVNPGNRLSYE